MSGSQSPVTLGSPVKFGWMDQLLPQSKISLYEDNESGRAKLHRAVNARKDIARFSFIENTDNWREGDEAEGKDWAKRLETISKVISVILVTFSVLMPLAVYYLPAWAPWGIGLPTILALSIAQSQIIPQIETYKREKEFVPLLAGFVKHHTVKTLQPIDEKDLPARDDRLKSDLMMREEIETGPQQQQNTLLDHPKAHDSRFDLDKPPYQQQRVAAIANRLDLEVTPFLQQAAAADFAGLSQKQQKWGKVQDLQADLFAAARHNDRMKFCEKLEERDKLAYESTVPMSTTAIDYPVRSRSLRSYLTSLTQLYRRFAVQFEELERLHKEGQALYGTAADFWPALLEEAHRTRMALEKYGNDPELLAKLDEPLFDSDIEPSIALFHLNDHTRVVKNRLQTWIDAHPTKRYAAIRTQLDEYAAQEVLTQKQVELFVRWIQTHPEERKYPEKRYEAIQAQLKQCAAQEVLTQKQIRLLIEWAKQYPIDSSDSRQALQVQLNLYAAQEILTLEQQQLFGRWVLRQPHEANKKIMYLEKTFPRELKPWIAKHPEMRFEVARDLFDRAVECRKQFLQARQQFSALEINAEAITAFESSVMKPLAATIAAQSGGSQFTKVMQTAFSKLPALPFASETSPEEAHLKARKFEEIHLNQLLRTIDAEMLFTNRARKYGLRIPLIILFAIEGIVALYLSTPWIFWGLSVLAALGEGVSYYVDQRLQQMERQKQAIKLQHILRDYPDIGVIPGTRPQLQVVKTVQEKYGLEGVRSTWARIIAEEQGTPFATRKELAEEGSQAATPYLRDVKLNLERKLAGTRKRNRKIKIEQKIQDIETALHPKKKAITESQAEWNEKQKIKKALDEITRQTLFGIQKLAQLNYKEEHFNRLALILPPKFFKRPHSMEEMKAYILTVEEAEQQVQARALEDLAKLQSDTEVATLKGLKKKRREITEALKEVQEQRREYLKQYKDPYEPLRRELQRVDEALDKLVENKITCERKLKEYQQSRRQFKQLEQKLNPQFVRQPVLQTEIDLLLESLKREPLAPISEQTIVAKDLLAHCKEKLNSALFSMISVSAFEYALFEEEINQLRTIPVAERQVFLKSLRELQLLQSEPEYQSEKEDLSTRCASIPKKIQKLKNQYSNLLSCIDHEIVLLKAHYKELSSSIKSVVPAPPIKSVKDAHVDNWWSLPAEVRDKVSGDALLSFCTHAQYPTLWHELTLETKVRLCSGALALWYSKIHLLHLPDPSGHTKWYAEFQKDLEGAFEKIMPSHQRMIFHLLPSPFQQRLKATFERCTGEDLLMAEFGEATIERFTTLDIFHQEYIYRNLPQSAKEAWTPFYEEYTGMKLTTLIIKVLTKLSKNKEFKFDAWWVDKKDKFWDHYKKIGPHYQQQFWMPLPAPLQAKRYEVVRNED